MLSLNKNLSLLILLVTTSITHFAHAASSIEAKPSNLLSNAYNLPLIDIKANPNGLLIPNTFLGIHLNRWKNSESKTFDYVKDYFQVHNVSVSQENGIAKLTTPKGHSFYYYRKGVTVILLGKGANGSDFITKVTGGTLGLATTPGVAILANVPPKLGSTTIQYRPYIPTFGYGAVRSHGSGVKWATLHLGPNSYNSELMSDWVKRHENKRLMFTMTDTPEWLATSNVSTSSRSVLSNKATINHGASTIGVIPVGTGIKIRNCSNTSLNGIYKVAESSPTSTSFIVNSPDEEFTLDTSTEILIWGNNGGYGINNPPKDMNEVNKFIHWLITNYGKNIEWIEGQNEANSSFLPNGSLIQNKGQSSWWMGSLRQLGEIQKRIYQSAKKINPAIQIGSPALTGLHLGQPINASPINKSSSLQMLTADDGGGGKLADWIDFVPFHIYDEGSTWKLRTTDKWTLYEMISYLRKTLSEASSNKPNIPIYMNEGGFEHYSNHEGHAYKYFNSLTLQEQSNEIFKQAAIYAGSGVKGFYPWTSGFLGDYETTPEISAVYNKINKRISGKTISPESWFNKNTGAMFFKTTDGYEEYIQ
jgi:hypothetical protein